MLCLHATVNGHWRQYNCLHFFKQESNELRLPEKRFGFLLFTFLGPACDFV